MGPFLLQLLCFLFYVDLCNSFHDNEKKKVGDRFGTENHKKGRGEAAFFQ